MKSKTKTTNKRRTPIELLDYYSKLDTKKANEWLLWASGPCGPKSKAVRTIAEREWKSRQ